MALHQDSRLVADVQKAGGIRTFFERLKLEFEVFELGGGHGGSVRPLGEAENA